MTSGWLPVQIGLIVAAALIAALLAAIVRRRFDLAATTQDWPHYTQHVARALIANFGLLVFIAAVGLARIGIQTWAPGPHTFLLDIAVNRRGLLWYLLPGRFWPPALSTVDVDELEASLAITDV